MLVCGQTIGMSLQAMSHTVRADCLEVCVRETATATHRQECHSACPYFDTQAGLALLHFEETPKLRNEGRGDEDGGAGMQA